MLGKIFYYCHNHDRPVEGQRQAYQHVDILNGAGFGAFALHPTDDFRLTWFPNTTATMGPLGFRQNYDPDRDYLVLPDEMGERIRQFPGKKVLFNQNIHKSFAALAQREPLRYPCLDESVKYILTVSDFARRHFEFAYPNKPVLKVRRQINPATFAYTPLQEKKN